MSIIPLKTTRKVLTWICVHPVDEAVSNRTKMGYAFFSITLFIINMNGLVASAAYLLKFISTDLESALYSAFQVDTLTATAYSNIVVLVSRSKFVAIFDELDNIFGASNSKIHIF